MNCYNQQFTGMADYNAQNRQQTAPWQNQPSETEIFGWQNRMMPGMDCGMPPATILPAGNVVQQKNVASQSPLGFAAKMENCMFPLAMSYVPMQKWCQPSPLCEGFRRGTMFRELDLPFVMGRCQ